MADGTVTCTEAKDNLNALLADVQRAGQSVTITNHGRPVAKLVPNDFDEPLPDAERARWESGDE